MTTPPEPADDGKIPPQETTPPSDQSSVPTEGSLPPANPAESANPPNPDEGLPEWEPLTPELVEDEAIRGDFVIRWAVVGLALLFGFAPITDTRTLVHVRTGEYLATNGFLPPANDVFSYTANDRKWVNLSWLFDLAAAGIHSVSGGIGLSILQGLLAGVAFGLIAHSHRSGIRTWWGSVCAVLALLVCYPQFTVQPELITLVGMGLLLWLLSRVEETGSVRMLWSSVAVIWVWSQFDTRAFLGWLLLVCMAMGETLRRSDDAKQRRSLWWQVAAASVAITIIHPFLWETWMSPIRLFAIDYPALQQAFPGPGRVELAFYPITQPAFWGKINHDSIAALVLFAATVVSLVLNRERLHPGHLIAVVAFNLLACQATHELAAASLVNCVVCTINAQTWYRHRFGQVYSVDWRELLFSRGGRAVTVFSFFAMAWLVISSRIDGPAGRRTGLGFDEGLQVQMDSYLQIAADNLDDRPFHFATRQGDLLIWSGQKSFIDMRAGLFSGIGDNDLIGLHNRTRNAMRQKRKSVSGSNEPEVWKATFEKFHLTHTLPRLSGPLPAPDYITFVDLLSSSEWALTDLTASAGVYYRDDKSPPVDEYVSKHRVDWVKKAFRTVDKIPETGRMCAKAATFSDSLFSVRQPRYPAGVQLAGHYVQLGGASGTISPQVRAACSMLAVRQSTIGLRDDPNSADGFRTLALAYVILNRIETDLMNKAGFQWFSGVRYYQTVAALQQAALLRPEDPQIHLDLLGLFTRSQRGELALDAIRQFKRVRPVTSESSEEDRKQREQLLNLEFSLEEMLGKIESQVEQQLQNGEERFLVAAFAHRAGAVRLAIRTLEDEPIYKEGNLQAKSALGAWLIEAGRVQEGLDAMEQSSGSGPAWRDSFATMLLINGEYPRAIDLWRDQIRETSMNGAQSALLSLPFVTLNQMWMGSDQYPFAHSAAAGEIVGNVRGENAMLTFQIGLAQLEQGDVSAATRSLQSVLNNSPNTQLRPLLKFYLEVLTDKTIEFPPTEPPTLEEFEPLGEESAK